MRINKFVALASDLSRRKADAAIAAGRVQLNGAPVDPGADVSPADQVTLDDQPLTAATKLTVMLNKPVGYVVSRDGQGSRTIYDLLPPAYQNLQPVGRLDKDSSGLLLLTNDGDLANNLSHPSHQKQKVYQVTLNKGLVPVDQAAVTRGVELEDGRSQLQLAKRPGGDDRDWLVTMHEGRNRQIRRTFTALNYKVAGLHRVRFGSYELGNLAPGKTAAL